MNEVQQAFERNFYYRDMTYVDGKYRDKTVNKMWISWQAACRWADGAEQVDRSVAIPEGRKTHEGYFKEQNKC